MPKATKSNQHKYKHLYDCCQLCKNENNNFDFGLQLKSLYIFLFQAYKHQKLATDSQSVCTFIWRKKSYLHNCIFEGWFFGGLCGPQVWAPNHFLKLFTQSLKGCLSLSVNIWNCRFCWEFCQQPLKNYQNRKLFSAPNFISFCHEVPSDSG